MVPHGLPRHMDALQSSHGLWHHMRAAAKETCDRRHDASHSARAAITQHRAACRWRAAGDCQLPQLPHCTVYTVCTGQLPHCTVYGQKATKLQSLRGPRTSKATQSLQQRGQSTSWACCCSIAHWHTATNACTCEWSGSQPSITLSCRHSTAWLCAATQPLPSPHKNTTRLPSGRVLCDAAYL